MDAAAAAAAPCPLADVAAAAPPADAAAAAPHHYGGYDAFCASCGPSRLADLLRLL